MVVEGGYNLRHAKTHHAGALRSSTYSRVTSVLATHFTRAPTQTESRQVHYTGCLSTAFPTAKYVSSNVKACLIPHTIMHTPRTDEIFHVNPKFYCMSVAWNLGLTWTISTPAPTNRLVLDNQNIQKDREMGDKEEPTEI